MTPTLDINDPQVSALVHKLIANAEAEARLAEQFFDSYCVFSRQEDTIRSRGSLANYHEFRGKANGIVEALSELGLATRYDGGKIRANGCECEKCGF